MSDVRSRLLFREFGDWWRFLRDVLAYVSRSLSCHYSHYVVSCIRLVFFIALISH